ncbi:uncharacterized protein LOC118736434 [Rhagoletis pomonella]|uniref:uncharacterized protein LOC118736434 n=1 Tax=Rhagoletis pomonella TaxID=28610 RepID=UPI0017876FF8|nr:uncharacterized protein LOC118736434 [Rhagoletis pomonella]
MKSPLKSVALVCWLLVASRFAQYFVATAAAAHATITDIKCTSLNRSFVDFAECRLRLVQRSLNEINIRLKILQPPLDNITVHLQFMKKSNGYRPYLIDTKFDACKFISTKSNPMINYLYDFIRPYTNINHSCPYRNELIVKNLRINQKLLTAATILPTGDYAFFTTWLVNNVKRAFLQLYVKYKENE